MKKLVDRRSTFSDRSEKRFSKFDKTINCKWNAIISDFKRLENRRILTLIYDTVGENHSIVHRKRASGQGSSFHTVETQSVRIDIRVPITIDSGLHRA